MARLMAKSMREIDDEDDPGKRLSGALPSIRIVPQRVRLPTGETKRPIGRLQLREGLTEEDEVLIELDPLGVAELPRRGLLSTFAPTAPGPRGLLRRACGSRAWLSRGNDHHRRASTADPTQL